MIHDDCKAKHEPTGATTAEEQPTPPQIAQAKRDVAERDSFKLILKVFLFILLRREIVVHLSLSDYPADFWRCLDCQQGDGLVGDVGQALPMKTRNRSIFIQYNCKTTRLPFVSILM